MKRPHPTLLTKSFMITGMIALLTLGYGVQAESVIGFDLSDLSGSHRVPPPEAAYPTEKPDSLQVSPIIRGSGIEPSPLAGGFSSNEWELVNPSREAAIANEEFYEFSVSSATETLSFQSLDCRLRVSSRRASFTAEWQYSLDGFATDRRTIAVYPRGFILMAGNGEAMPQIDLSKIEGLQQIPPDTEVTFRLYAWGGAETPTNTFAIGRSRAPYTEGGEFIGNALEIVVTRES